MSVLLQWNKIKAMYHNILDLIIPYNMIPIYAIIHCILDLFNRAQCLTRPLNMLPSRVLKALLFRSSQHWSSTFPLVFDILKLRSQYSRYLPYPANWCLPVLETKSVFSGSLKNSDSCFFPPVPILTSHAAIKTSSNMSVCRQECMWKRKRVSLRLYNCFFFFLYIELKILRVTGLMPRWSSNQHQFYSSTHQVISSSYISQRHHWCTIILPYS